MADNELNPAFNDFWASKEGQLEIVKWRRKMRRKIFFWRATVTLSETGKRVLDIIGSSVALICFSPIFAITALLIKLEDRGPIVFSQTRVGESGRAFQCLKFRSMVVNADQIKADLSEQNQHEAGVTFKMKDDPRITKVGKYIRKLSIDEFPQFYNVLRGDMSLVGPRPPVPREVAEYKAFHLRRLMVKPGITCLWQIGGRADIDFEGQVRLDLQYIAAQSLSQDILILLKTVPAVLLGKGAY
ncbi:sugar transferase [Cerasicoccus maritimus]|uniref:sugar transferase n=1 Tax=Cerasicoccus maritimus TaxID=490089 RepID=UPI0028526B03|nr:sugar transferase [Cerasicoccus maritimus]